MTQAFTHHDCILAEKFAIKIIGRTADNCRAVQVAYTSGFVVQTDIDAKSSDVWTVHISTVTKENDREEAVKKEHGVLPRTWPLPLGPFCC